MSSADVIVLSSPENPSSRPSAYTCDKLFEYSPKSSSPLSLSPSELFAPLSRSKYFPSPCPQRKTSRESKEETVKENASTIKTKRNTTEDKAKQRRKAADKPQTVIEDLGYTSLPTKKESVARGTAKPKKSRANNATKRGDSGNKMLKGRVAKVGIVDVDQERKAVIQPSSTPSKRQDAAILQENARLHLEGAMTRRLDWTPPKDTSKLLIDFDDARNPETNRKSTNMFGFGNMLSAYNFSDSPAPRDKLQATGGGGPTKRRRIELVASNGLDKAPAEAHTQHATTQDKKKPKRQAKKINTLTGRVTARYGTDDVEGVTDEGEAGHLCEPVRKRKTKKTNDSEFTVLSPEAAVKALDEQDLVFGTCSQLEREESPSSLRDMQTAIRDSEASMHSEHRTQSSSFELGSTRNLWSVAARDSEGSLVQAEMLNMVDISNTPNVPPKNKCLREKQRLECFELESESEQESVPREKTSMSDKGPAEHESLPISQQTEAHAGKSGKDISKTVESFPMPQYSGFTDAELAKQVAAYGFKPLKSRQKMIDLLQKCWEAKHGPSSKSGQVDKQEDLPASTMQPTVPGRKIKTATKPNLKSKQVFSEGKKKDPSTTSTKRNTKKQTRSTTRAPAQPVEVIEDSEEEVIPSPSRLQTRYTSGSPTDSQPLPISKGPQSPTRSSRADPSRRTSLPDLASQITKAVRAQSHSLSSDRARPSWHEKILMYDPITLEDFAAWLNIEGFGLVGEDREVSAGSVREWCESKGICCCWKKGAGW